ncbi:MAG: hypothetical protein KatS3mg131_0739 [Candidatus Tectimicrobiota bacterium]|nr:MAG: hypothetical protein KatS3mg131_0739 [Candidatus Tectomicrobia bacterium]
MADIPMLSEREGFGAVFQCPDGVIHLACGFVTLRLREQAFADLVLLVREARDALVAQRRAELLPPRGEAGC